MWHFLKVLPILVFFQPTTVLLTRIYQNQIHISKPITKHHILLNQNQNLGKLNQLNIYKTIYVHITHIYTFLSVIFPTVLIFNANKISCPFLTNFFYWVSVQWLSILKMLKYEICYSLSSHMKPLIRFFRIFKMFEYLLPRISNADTTMILIQYIT